MKFFSLYFVLIFILGCSQNKKEMSLNLVQNPEINSKNIVEEIYKQIKHYPKEPRYFINIISSSCYIEIYINDVIAFKDFKRGTFQTGEEIGNLLLFSGIQKMKIKAYPLEENKNFTTNSELNITIDTQNNLDETEQADILQYSFPKEDKNINILEKKYYEETITFNLPDVPYHNIGWSESQDLRKMNSTELEKKVLGYYQDMQNAIKNKDLDKIAMMSYNKLRDQFVSEYATREEVQEAWDEIVEVVNMDKELFPLEDYEMVFYGDGKLVGLRSKKMDEKFRGTSALFMKIKKDGQTLGTEFYHLLHVPKGKTEFEVY